VVALRLHGWVPGHDGGTVGDWTELIWWGLDGGLGRLDGEDSMVFLRGLGAMWDWAGGIDFLGVWAVWLRRVGCRFYAWNRLRCGIGAAA